MRMRWTGRQALMTGCCLLAGLLGVWLGEAVGRQGPELWLLSPALEALLLAPAAVLACRLGVQAQAMGLCIGERFVSSLG